MRNQRFTLLVGLLLFCFGMAFGVNSIDVRLNHNTLNQIDNSLFVDIEVRVGNTNSLVLAGQNYRIYYPSDLLSLDKKRSKSQLSTQLYSKLQFSSVLENVQAMGKGALKFDQNLGFANLSVDLLDSSKGGESVTAEDGWVTIATLKFDILDEFEELSMIWGREGKSERYATAFVEIAEWKSPSATDALEINEYIDFNLSVNSLNLEETTYEISVGPNPAVDFVQIRSDLSLSDDVYLNVRDISGQLVREEKLFKGNRLYNIDISDLQAASYILELTDLDGHGFMAHKIVVTR